MMEDHVMMQVLREYAFGNIADVDFSWFAELSAKNTRLKNGAVVQDKAGNDVCEVDVSVSG